MGDGEGGWGGGADHPRRSAAGRARASLASPLSPAGALGAIAAEGLGELPSGSGVAELGGGGKEAEEKLGKLGFFLNLAREIPGRPPPTPPPLKAWGWGCAGEQKPSAPRGWRRAAWATSWPRVCRRRRGQGGGARAEGLGAGAAVARAVAERRQQVAPFAAAAAAARPLGRGAAGGGVGARVCESVRAVAPPPPAPLSVPLARRGRAALRVSALPPLLLLLHHHFASSSL